MFKNSPTFLDSSTILLNEYEYVAVDDDISTAPMLTDKEILVIIYNPNDSTHIDSDDESDNENKDAFLVLFTLEIRKIIKYNKENCKITSSYLDEHSNEEK